MLQITPINASYARIEGDIPPHLHALLTAKLSYRPENYKFMKRKYKGWDGTIRLYAASGRFPAGLAPVVETMCNRQNIPVVNLVNVVDEDDGIIIDNSLTLKPRAYQIEAADWAIRNKRGIMLSATSSGKTLIAYMIASHYVRAGMKLLIIVPSVDLLNQIRNDFDRYSKFDWFGAFSAQCDVFTWQKLQHADDEYFEQYDAVIVDEVHLAKAKELRRILSACINAYYRIGMTGTLDKGKKSNMLLYGMFGMVKEFSNNKRLMEMGYIARSHTKFVFIDHGGIKVPRKYNEEIEYIETSEARNRVVVDMVANAGGNSFVMVSKVKHGEMLCNMLKEAGIDAYHMTMKTKPEDRAKLFDRFETNDGMVIVATYSLISTGISINNLHNLFLASPTKSVIRYMQSIGRVLRLHDSKDVANIYDFVDMCDSHDMYCLRHGMARIAYTMDYDMDFSEEVIKL